MSERPWYAHLLTRFRLSPRHCPLCGRMGEAIPKTNETAWMCWDCEVGWRSEKQKKVKTKSRGRYAA